MISQNILNSKNFINFLILLIPISFIVGNLMINLNIIILLASCFFVYKLKIFQIPLNKIDKIILLFFLYIFINAIFNNFFNFNFSGAPDNLILIISFLYFRFLLLYFAIKFLIIKNIINYKLFFYSLGLCSLFVSFDIIIQFFFGRDLFGLEGAGRRLTGPFGDEYIAGSYIQRFFIFLPFALLIFTKNKETKIFKLILFSILGISMFGILFAGNRMPFLLFILTLPMIFFYAKNLRKPFLIMLVLFTVGFSFLYKTNLQLTNHVDGFKIRSSEVLDYAKTRFETGEVKPYNVYIKEFESGFLTWEKNKFFGGGIKSFYWHCSNVERVKMIKFLTKNGLVNCNNHPHNYYLEILAELGLTGIILVIAIFLTIIIKSIYFIHFSNSLNIERKIVIPFFIILLSEIFPLKTTGSFFTTSNATFLFIILSFVVGLIHVVQSRNL